MASRAGRRSIAAAVATTARARAVTPEIESGHVFLPLPPPAGEPGEFAWVHDFLAEARSFPTGEHDDQIDSMSQALDELRETGGAAITNPAAGGRAPSPAAQRLIGRSAPRNIAATARTVRRVG